MGSSDNEKEMLNVSDDNETDINKIRFASHNYLLASSMENTYEIIEKKKQIVKFLIKKKK